MYILGVAAGIVTAFAVLALVILLIRKKTHQKGFWAKYDERQQAARGRGYKYAFFTMLILTAASLCWYSAADGAGFPVPHVLWGIILAGLLVYASYAIWSDAYIAPNETFRSSVILMAVIALVNLTLGSIDLVKNGFSEAYLNLGIGAVLAVISLEMLAKNLFDRKQNDDAE